MCWVASGSNLTMMAFVTGQCPSSHHDFGDKTVGLVTEFVWRRRRYLLVELLDSRCSSLCCYCLSTSRVLRAISFSTKISCMEVIGVSSFRDMLYLHSALQHFSGIAVIGTEQGDLLLLDLALETEALFRTESKPAEFQLMPIMEGNFETGLRDIHLQGKHPGVCLHSHPEARATSLLSVRHTSQLVVGYSTGKLHFWNLKHLNKESEVQFEREPAAIVALQFQESSNVRTPRCFVWAVSSEQSREGGSVSLNLVELLFQDFNRSSPVHYQGLLHVRVCHRQRLCDGVEPSPSASFCRFLSSRVIGGCERTSESDASQQSGAQRNLHHGILVVLAWEVKKAESFTFVALFSLHQWLQEEKPYPLKSNSELEGCRYLNVWSMPTRHTPPLPALDITVFKNLHWCERKTWNKAVEPGNPVELLVLGAATMYVDCFTHHRFPAYQFKPVSIKGFSADVSVQNLCSIMEYPTDQVPPFCPQEETLQYLLTRALINKSIRSIIRWTKSLLAGDPDMENTAHTFCSWVCKMADHCKKQLLFLCFSSCQGQWMNMGQTSLNHVFNLVQVLRNLLTIIQFLKKQPHLLQWDGGMNWDREHRSVKRHIWLGKVVHWFGLTGLLANSSDAWDPHQVCQMWSLIQHNYRTAVFCKEEECGLLIQGIVSCLKKQQVRVWTTQEPQSACYPPPSLQAVLKLFLKPRIDIVSVQAIFLYFLLDVTHFLHYENNLLKSFSLAFDVPPGFCQQIKGFWFLDQRQISCSMELLVHPSTLRPWHSWQHSLIIQVLLKEGERQTALNYIHWSKPAIEKPKDLKLCIDVFLHNRCAAHACSLLKEIGDFSDDILKHFLHSCDDLGLLTESMALIISLDKEVTRAYFTESTRLQTNSAMSFSEEEPPNQEISFQKAANDRVKKQSPKPFSASLYRASASELFSPKDVMVLLRESILDLSETCPPIREKGTVLWPEYLGKDTAASQTSGLFLSAPNCPQAVSSPSPTSSSSGCESEQSEQDESVTAEDLQPAEPDDKKCSCTLSLTPESSSSVFTTSSLLDADGINNPASSEGFGDVLPDVSYLLHDAVCEVMDDSLEGDNEFTAEDLSHPDFLFTLYGDTESVALNSLSKETVEDNVPMDNCSTEESVNLPQTCAIAGAHLWTEEGAASFCEDIAHNRERRGSRMNLHLQFCSNEDNRASFPACAEQEEPENFLSPDRAKMNYTKVMHKEISCGTEGGTKNLCCAAPTEEKTKNLSFSQGSLTSSSFSSHFFLDLEPLQRAMDYPVQEEFLEQRRRESQEAVDQPEILTSCVFTESMQTFFIDYPKSPVLEDSEGDDAGTLGSTARKASTARKTSLLDIETELKVSERYKQAFSLQETSLIIPPPRTARHRHSLGSGPFPSLRGHRHRALPHFPSEKAPVRSPYGKPCKKEAVCFKTTSDRLGHCKLGSWWKQALESRRASAGLLPAIDQFTSTSSDKKTSAVSARSHSHGSFFQSAPKQKVEKGEAKQMGKEEPVRKRSTGRFTMSKAEKTAGVQRVERAKRSKKFKRK
ncbi:protein ELYS isoform X2 [Amia ocellicauda]|uniref:protein ELYS isoform X2 n=1 Tax=Amia ocellicauda TaxID=2972642 RepID=UPI003463D1D0